MEELLKGCRKGLKIGQPELQIPCKSKDIGLELFFECLVKGSSTCESSLPYGHSYYCKCVLRVFMAIDLEH
jgi:hypothetical protein